MKRILLMASAALMLAGCGTDHVRDQVRQVEVQESIVSDGYTDIIYYPNVDLSSLDEEYEPDLYVNIKDVDTGTVFKVPVGTECSTFPAEKGLRFLAKFDIRAYKEKPQELYLSPYSEPITKLLCS
jgi:hypothetical protein